MKRIVGVACILAGGLCLPLVAHAQQSGASSVVSPYFKAPSNAPSVESGCIQTLNSIYEGKVRNALAAGSSINSHNNPTKFACLGGLLKGFTLGWPSINLASILSTIENEACSALTSVLNSQVESFGTYVQLPGGLGSVNVEPSYSSGIGQQSHDISGQVGTSIWDMGPGGKIP